MLLLLKHDGLERGRIVQGHAWPGTHTGTHPRRRRRRILRREPSVVPVMVVVVVVVVRWVVVVVEVVRQVRRRGRNASRRTGCRPAWAERLCRRTPQRVNQVSCEAKQAGRQRLA